MPLDGVEGFCKVNKNYEKIAVMLSTFSCSCLAKKIMSIVLLSLLNPHCVSARTSSAIFSKSRTSMIRANAFPVDASNEMPGLLSHISLSPFFLYILIILASLHCCGVQPVRHTDVINDSRQFPTVSQPNLSNSAGSLSVPGDLMF